jgi:hypothetical protein
MPVGTTEPDAVGLRLHRELARSLYAGSVRLQARIGADAMEGKPWLADARRLVQRMVDLMQEDATALVSLTSIKAVQTRKTHGFVRTHGVNVAILSILLGRQARLSRPNLAEVGLAGFMHDVGRDATGDSGVHALHGAECLLQLGPAEMVMRPALVALEHHIQEEEQGEATLGEPDAATRIVRVADAYDTLTACTGAAGRPDRVLRFLLRQAGKRFDAVLVKLLAHALGVYPPGTVVRLDSGDVGIVMRPSRDPRHLDRPLVRLLRDPAGRPSPGVATADLSERGAHGYVRTIACALDPATVGLAPTAILLGTI